MVFLKTIADARKWWDDHGDCVCCGNKKSVLTDDTLEALRYGSALDEGLALHALLEMANDESLDRRTRILATIVRELVQSHQARYEDDDA